MICDKDYRPDSKAGRLDCKVYEPQPTEPPRQQFLKENTEVRGSVPCLWSSLESEPGRQDETVDGESRAKEQNMLDLNPSTVSGLWSVQHRVSF